MERLSLNISYVSCAFEDLSSEDAALVVRAKEICEHSYAPYSKFCVGAAVSLDNVERQQIANRIQTINTVRTIKQNPQRMVIAMLRLYQDLPTSATRRYRCWRKLTFLVLSRYRNYQRGCLRVSGISIKHCTTLCTRTGGIGGIFLIAAAHHLTIIQANRRPYTKL